MERHMRVMEMAYQAALGMAGLSKIDMSDYDWVNLARELSVALALEEGRLKRPKELEG